jgi:hypothetical protein
MQIKKNNIIRFDRDQRDEMRDKEMDRETER